MPNGTRLIQPRKRGVNPDLLNPKQHLFVQHMLADHDFNAAKAAEKAGYAPPYSQAANKLMNRPAIQKAIGKAIWERKEELRIDGLRVLKELARIGFSDPRKMFTEDGVLKDLIDMDEDTARAISGIDIDTFTDEEGNVRTKTKIHFWSKTKSLELIAKHLGMLDERITVQGDGTPQAIGNVLTRLLDEVERRNNVIDAKVIEHKASS